MRSLTNEELLAVAGGIQTDNGSTFTSVPFEHPLLVEGGTVGDSMKATH